jgi:hypothetical protein
MLEYTGTSDGLRLKMLVLPDDAKREYAYGPAEGLPEVAGMCDVSPKHRSIRSLSRRQTAYISAQRINACSGVRRGALLRRP